MTRRRLRGLCAVLALGLGGMLSAAAGAEPVRLSRGESGRVSIVARDAPLEEVFEMLARKERVSVLLGEGVEGKVSVNLFEVNLDRAIRAIAEAAGYVAERRHGTYAIIERDEAGKDSAAGNTVIRSYKIEHAGAEEVGAIVEKYLSRYGEVDVLPDRRMLVVEDLPEFQQRVVALLREIDREPRLIFIEARILEIQLDEDETIGIDWEAGFKDGSVGVRDLAFADAAGFFFDFMNKDIEIQISALTEKGRVRTLSTPTLLAVEHKEAEVVIGDRLGFKVTTTINQVTTESVEFLESGVILRFTASVDRDGRIVLDIHPEVSNGTIQEGLPQQRTTEVTTRLRAESGRSVFIAGLIKDGETTRRTGVPFLMDIPVLGRLFQQTKTTDINTETVVILTAHIVGEDLRVVNERRVRETLRTDAELRESARERSRRVPPVEPLTETLGGMPSGGYEERSASPDGPPPPAPAAPTPAAP